MRSQEQILKGRHVCGCGSLRRTTCRRGFDWRAIDGEHCQDESGHYDDVSRQGACSDSATAGSSRFRKATGAGRHTSRAGSRRTSLPRAICMLVSARSRWTVRLFQPSSLAWTPSCLIHRPLPRPLDRFLPALDLVKFAESPSPGLQIEKSRRREGKRVRRRANSSCAPPQANWTRA